MRDAATKHPEGPWNNGLSSTIPRRFLHLSTMFRPENVSTSLAEAEDLADFTGLSAKDLVTFRLERLVVHELLVRIMADVSVPDGSHYGHLGINSRRYTDVVLRRYIAPSMEEISGEFDEVVRRANETADRFLTLPKARTGGKREGWWQKFLKTDRAATPVEPVDRIERWRQGLDRTEDALERSVLEALVRVGIAISAKHGHLLGDADLLRRIAVTFVVNQYGSEWVGHRIAPLVEEGIESEGFRFLPIQDKPVIMNVKGASAAGKSTLRPLQQSLARRIGVDWQDFALISPDIWRKYLLDYDSLGDARKYAGMLTGHELEIVDQKLDRYMAEKALEDKIPHLLVDRFRFDSFATQPGEEEGGRLLTRFGDLVYMFFVVTPPEATVERAWNRGQEYGRYKAVDDLLDHNVEAFTGMPRLFFTWALNNSKRVHYEFLDNRVPKGERPKTIAFGWNREMTVFDVERMVSIDRYAKININANCPEDVYDVKAGLAPEDNTAFLRGCAEKLSVMTLADQDTGKTYAEFRDGKVAWMDAEAVAELSREPDFRAGLSALLGEVPADRSIRPEKASTLAPATCHTLGNWGRQD